MRKEMSMMEKYESLEIEVVAFDTEDVIAASEPASEPDPSVGSSDYKGNGEAITK